MSDAHAEHTSQNAHPWGECATPYEQLGGEQRVLELTNAFYDEVASDALMAELHPDDLTESREKFFEFLSGWLGGPQLYTEKRGHPRLRMRHAPFPIDEPAVHAWLGCMGRALDRLGVAGQLRAFLDNRFAHTAHFMQNRE